MTYPPFGSRRDRSFEASYKPGFVSRAHPHRRYTQGHQQVVMTPLRTVTGLLVCAVTGACADTAEDHRWIGDLVAVTSSEEATLCPGTLEFWDTVMKETYRTWYRAPPPDDLRLELELRSSSLIEDGRRGGAHVQQGTAWAAQQDSVLHELTHLAVGARDGASAPSLTEGTADAFGRPNRISPWLNQPIEPKSFFFLPREEFEGTFYLPSSQLIRVLVDEYGMPSLREAYRATRGLENRDAIEASMVAVFGDGFYDVLDAYMTSLPAPLQAWECDGEVVPMGELPLSVAGLPDCPEEDALGVFIPDDDAWYPFRMVTLDIHEPTNIEVDVTDNAVVYIEKCIDSYRDATPQSAEVFIDRPNLGVAYPWMLEQGRYVVTLQPQDPARPYAASIVAVPPE